MEVKDVSSLFPKKIVLIGPAPSRTSGRRAFRGLSGERLAELAGMDLREFLRAVNLIGSWPGKAGRGDAFCPAEGAAAAGRMRLQGRVVVACGGNALRSFGVRGWGWLARVDLGRGEASAWAFPHPSGVNRWWNDAGNRGTAGRLLRRILRGHPG